MSKWFVVFVAASGSVGFDPFPSIASLMSGCHWPPQKDLAGGPAAARAESLGIPACLVRAPQSAEKVQWPPNMKLNWDPGILSIFRWSSPQPFQKKFSKIAVENSPEIHRNPVHSSPPPRRGTGARPGVAANLRPCRRCYQSACQAMSHCRACKKEMDFGEIKDQPEILVIHV